MNQEGRALGREAGGHSGGNHHPLSSGLHQPPIDLKAAGHRERPAQGGPSRPQTSHWPSWGPACRLAHRGRREAASRPPTPDLRQARRGPGSGGRGQGCALTGREGVDVQSHVLLLAVHHVQQVGSDGPLGGVSAEIQDHHSQHREHDANGLPVGDIAEGQTWPGTREQPNLSAQVQAGASQGDGGLPPQPEAMGSLAQTLRTEGGLLFSPFCICSVLSRCSHHSPAGLAELARLHAL